MSSHRHPSRLVLASTALALLLACKARPSHAGALAGDPLRSVAVASDATTFLWGYWDLSDYCALGIDAGSLPDGFDSCVPFRVRRYGNDLLSGVAEVDAIAASFVARMEDGTVRAWGIIPATLGDAVDPPTYPDPGYSRWFCTATRLIAPGGMALEGVTDLDAGHGGIAVVIGGRVHLWGDSRWAPIAGEASGIGGNGALGDAVEVALGNGFALARLADGRVAAWGSGLEGQLGQPIPSLFELSPVLVQAAGGGALQGVQAISAAGSVALARLADGSIVSWGTSSFGELGQGETQLPAMAALPSPVVGVGGVGTLVANAISAGDGRCMALLPDGGVAAWGRNEHGELGRGNADADPHSVPERVLGPGGVGLLEGIATLAEGAVPLVAGADGRAWAWGDGINGRLCIPADQFPDFERYAPVQVARLDVLNPPPPCTAPPPAPAAPAGPASAEAGTTVTITWAAVPGAEAYEVDVGLDGSVEHATNLTEAGFTVSGLGALDFSVRAVNGCGRSAWSPPSTMRITFASAGCVQVGLIPACFSASVEDPPGTFTGTGITQIGMADANGAYYVDGTVVAQPATGALAWAGTLFLDGPLGRLDLYEYDPGSAFGVQLPADSPPPQLLPLPTNVAEWIPQAAAGLRRKLDGLPCVNNEGPAPRFVLNCIPFVTPEILDAALKVPLLFPCVGGVAQFGLPGLPENPGWQLNLNYQVCREAPYIRGVTVGSAEARLAGCALGINGGTLDQDASGSLFVGLQSAHLTCPLLANARANANGVKIFTDHVDFRDVMLELGGLSFGDLLSLPSASFSLTTRDPESLGYVGCATGRLDLLQFGFEADAVVVGGTLQRACLSLADRAKDRSWSKLLPLSFGQIGGCVQFPVDDLQPNEGCALSPTFSIDNPCLTCLVGTPNVRLQASMHASEPSVFGAGSQFTLDKGHLAIGVDGIRLGANVRFAGRRFGTGQLCASKSAAEICARVTVLDIVTGQANLALDRHGITGRIAASVDFPRVDLFCPACLAIDPEPITASVYLGPYETDPFFSGPITRYGLVASVNVLRQNPSIGIDLRSFAIDTVGIKQLRAFTGLAPGLPALPAGVVASRSFVVEAGAATAWFAASHPAGPPTLTLTPPTGPELDASSPSVDVLTDEDATAFGIASPEPGTWTVSISGVPDDVGLHVVASGSSRLPAVTLTEPSGDTTLRRVAWTATEPAAGDDIAVRVIATTDENAEAGAGVIVGELALVAGEQSIDVADGLLENGAWRIVVEVADGLGRTALSSSPGRIVVEDTTPPEPPASASVEPLFDGARVTFTASPSPDVVAYQVLARSFDEPPWEIVLDGRLPSRDVRGLPVGPHAFSVRAIDINGLVSTETDAGVASADDTLDGVAPAVPGPPELAPGSDSFTATWEPVSTADHYLLWYGVDELLTGRQAAEGASPVRVAGTSVTLSGFEPGQVLRAALSAVDAAGNESRLGEARLARLGSQASTDGDQLPDAWEALFLAGADTSDGGGDADDDLLPDLAEWLGGTDPLAFDPFTWGDVAPPGALDGEVDIADAVRALRLVLELDAATGDDRRRADVAPAAVAGGVATPASTDDADLTIADVVLILRAAVGLERFADPLDVLEP